MKKNALSPCIINHIYFNFYFLERYKLIPEIFGISKLIFLLIFLFIINENSTYSKKKKIRVLGCILFFNFGTKVHIIQNSGI